jgi:hypothetical protein
MYCSEFQNFVNNEKMKFGDDEFGVLYVVDVDVVECEEKVVVIFFF